MAANAPQPIAETQAQHGDAVTATAPVSSPIQARHIYVLVVYYTILLAGALAVLIALIVKQEAISPLLRMVTAVSGGAVVGSVLYLIRMLFRFYIKSGDFNLKWLPKYFTAPWEAVALSVVVLSLIQGGGTAMGGSKVNVAEGNPLAAFGVGALVGFGIREVVGWLGNMVKTMFPNEPHE